MRRTPVPCLAAAGTLAAVLLAGCTGGGDAPTKHEVRYTVDLTQGTAVPDPDFEPHITYLGAEGLRVASDPQLPWTLHMTLEDYLLPLLQLHAWYTSMLGTDPHFHCTIEVDGTVVSEHFGTGLVDCYGKTSPAAG